MKNIIEEFIHFKRMAVVGVSDNPRKYGAIVYRTMKSRGYDMLAVNPNLSSFDGDPCYPNLTALPEAVDGAVLVIPPPNVLQVLRDADAAGIRYVWLQPGAESQEAIALASELGLNLIYDACVMVEAPKSFASV